MCVSSACLLQLKSCLTAPHDDVIAVDGCFPTPFLASSHTWMTTVFWECGAAHALEPALDGGADTRAAPISSLLLRGISA